jgi:hypothetical protein
VTTATTARPGLVRVAEERNTDKVIRNARTRAQQDGVTVLIMRTDKRERSFPVLEITPQGDVCEVLAPTLRATLRDRFEEQSLDVLDVRTTGQARARASTRFAQIVVRTNEVIAAKSRRSA